MSGPLRLLVVDQGDLTRRHYGATLEIAGYRCEYAADGESALRRISERDIDAVIADSRVPGLDVFDLAGAPGAAACLLVFALPTARGGRGGVLRPSSCMWLRQPTTVEELRAVLECVLACAEKIREGEPNLDQAAILAHEFRSPLATMHTTAETLCRGYFGKLTPEQQEAVESIERNCGYLEDTITCVGDFYELERGQFAAPAVTVDLASGVVAPVLARPEYRDNRKGMPLVLDVGERVEVASDPRLLMIVVNNLVNNAIKYGTAGSDILVRVYRNGDQAMLSVRNEGIGIPAADMGRLFQRFGRLRQRGSEGIKGSGLGLHVCRRIVELLGGSIEAQSEPGRYAEFRVALELA